VSRYADISGLDWGTTYYWQVRALNPQGPTYANGSETAYWSFTTRVLPGAFNKTYPTDGMTDRATSLRLYWGASGGATSYEYCYDSTDDGACTGTWVSTGVSRYADLSGLDWGTTYYWQVRALNPQGPTYADGSETAFWSFTTTAP
jgi:hypothetical protein